MIDLRSDTVTLPSKEMKQFLIESPIGDDVYGEDPSINHLQKKIAKIFNKEAALFVPSGTMANLISVLTHCDRGDEILLGNKSHIFYYEAGGVSAYGGIHSHQLKNNDDGTIDIADIKNSIRKIGDDHYPKTKLLCLENTHNYCYGSPIGSQYFKDVKKIIKEYDIKIHIDGARIFNAAQALGESVEQLTEHGDSISCCLSKGLSAPVGSLIIGNKQFIQKAKRIRKSLGGGMRQAGLLAAAGTYSLDFMISRLEEDQKNAQELAQQLSAIDNIKIDISKVKTNIIFFHLISNNISDEQFLADLIKNNIKIDYKGNRKFRLVTHSGFETSNIQTVTNIIKKIIKDS